MNPDPIHRRALTELRGLIDWLHENHAKGYVGEVGWPDDHGGDAAAWNSVAQEWFKAADAERLWVTAWATGEWWGNYPLAVYKKRRGPGVDFADSQASVLERHLAVPDCLRGVNVCGAEFGVTVNGSFSNHDPGVCGKQYHYDGRATYGFLRGRGIRVVRLPFRWERLQPRPGEAFDEPELARLKEAVSLATGAGLEVILDLHNYGEYFLFDGAKGVRRTIGTPEVPVEQFADVWRRLSVAFKDDPHVFYGLMNEPHDFPKTADASPEKLWEAASRAALDAIRRNGDKKLVLVPGYNWSGVRTWRAMHPAGWISDPADNFRYEAHHYWDADASGTYRQSYRDELKAAEPATRPAVATRPADK